MIEIRNEKSLKKEIEYIHFLMEKNGPSVADYATLDNWYNSVWKNYGQDEVALKSIRKALSPVYNNSESLFGLVYSAPHGYKGDYEIIDRIYQQDISKDVNLKKWDEYFQQTPGAKAVRNRKTYFKNILVEKCSTNQSLTVLNLASGPCRDLKEFYERQPNAPIIFDCIELDKNAIAYGQQLTRNNPKIHFIHQNIFRFSTDRQYDLIWSAGLFDYFDNKTFSRILQRFIKNVKAEGEIILGNFHLSNPTKGGMDVTAWHLHHRTEEQLITLAQAAGIKDVSRITIEQEAEGVNLFMRIRF